MRALFDARVKERGLTLPRARALLSNLPASTEEETRTKLVAEAQVLSEAGQYQEALAVQEQAVLQFPDNSDLLYEQAMLADKAGQPALMERLLRQKGRVARMQWRQYSLALSITPAGLFNVAPEDADKAIAILQAHGEDAYRLGTIVEGDGVELV